MGIGPMTHLMPRGTLTPLLNPASGAPADSPSRSQAYSPSLSQAHSQSLSQVQSTSFSGSFSRRKDGLTLESVSERMGRCGQSSCSYGGWAYSTRKWCTGSAGEVAYPRYVAPDMKSDPLSLTHHTSGGHIPSSLLPLPQHFFNCYY